MSCPLPPGRFSHRFAEPSNSLQATIRCLRITIALILLLMLDKAMYVYSDWGTAPIPTTIFRETLSILRRLWSQTRILDALNDLARVKSAAITTLSMTSERPRREYGELPLGTRGALDRRRVPCPVEHFRSS